MKTQMILFTLIYLLFVSCSSYQASKNPQAELNKELEFSRVEMHDRFSR